MEASLIYGTEQIKKTEKNKEWKLKIKPICSTVAVLSTVCGVSPESLRWEEFVTRS